MWLDGDVAPRALYNWTTNPDGMAHTWQAAINANADKDMIWTVGLRGLWDYTCTSLLLHPPSAASCWKHTPTPTHTPTPPLA
jgi:hypothetical protein